MTSSGVIPEPEVRPDGLCTVCLKPRQPVRSRKYAGLEAERDPFCSNTCARRYFRQPDLDEQGRERRVESGRMRRRLEAA